ncbi:MAG: carboxypeptidase-like regulatory domain-containing protein [Saprospiraceae bacterium]|nr:carboxypeptidase-like regulatory domain-containing protein [Saprospiraceae bacterium]
MLKLTKPALVLIILLCSLAAKAQQITGTVTSSKDGTPLIAVNITVKESLTGTVSDTDGTFQIAASPGNTLVFSYIGFKTLEIKLGNENNLNIALEEDAQSLDEIVVTALGIEKESKKLVIP